MGKNRIYLLVISFVFGVVFNFSNPVLPLFVKELQIAESYFGLYLASTGIGLFIFSAFWGAIGDIKDRNKVLAITFYGFGLGQILFGSFSNPLLLLVASMISGVFTSGVLVNIYSYINDNFSDKRERDRMLSFNVSLILIGASIGYLLGGYFANLFIEQYRYIFMIQGVFSFLFGLYIYYEKTDLIDTDHHLTRQYFIQNMKYVFRLPWLPLSTIVLTFLISFSHNNVKRFFDYYVLDNGLEVNILGWIVFVTGIVCLFANLFVTPYLLRRRHNLLLLITIFIIAPLALYFTFSGENSLFQYFSFFMVYHFVMAVYEPTAISLMSMNNDLPQGVLVGVRQSIVGLGMTIGFVVGGVLYEINELYVFYFAILFYIIVLVGFIIISIILNRQIIEYKGD